MNQAQILSGLNELDQIFEEMKALLEWQKLQYDLSQQKSISNIRLNDHTSSDFAQKYLSFISLSTRLRRLLNDKSLVISKQKRKAIMKEIITLEHKAFYLGSPVRIYWQWDCSTYFLNRSPEKHEHAVNAQTQGLELQE